jgi:quinohemoprotein ethanol dehydrogenase
MKTSGKTMATRTGKTSFAALIAALAVLVTALGATAKSGGDRDWPIVGGTSDEQFYSPLTQIDDGNVGTLGLVWSANLDTERGVEGAPLYEDGVLYVTSAWNVTRAYDAKTGTQLWAYDPKVPVGYARWACCDVVSRGMALWQDKAIIATLDGRVIALDRKTGKEVWSAKTLDREGRYAVTGAPRVFNGIVVIGNAGGDANARGYVTALDANTGKRLWRFYTVPGNPDAPDGEVSDKPLRDIADPTWKGNGEWWKLGGGGTPWDGIVYDKELNLLYIGVGNGGPMAQALRSPGGGDNLFLASIVAVRPETGEYVWHYQENPGEEWDYTSTQPILLADLTIDGKPRKVLMHAPKNGFFYVIDRTNGKVISAEKYTVVNWADKIDLVTGRPVENLEITRAGNEPRLFAPGPAGGHNWHPMSYNHKTGLVYFPVTEHWIAYPFGGGRPEGGLTQEQTDARRKKAGELMVEAEKREKGWLAAWDPIAQREVWRVPHTRAGSGGVLSTAGNVVFQGNPERKLAAYRATDGKLLWQYDTQNVPIAAPITYTIDGEQYVAATTGWGGGMALVEMSQGLPPLRNGAARLLVFKLGGKAELPPFKLASVATKPEPPLSRAPEALVEKGRVLFADKCAMCHGTNARGGLKDLRWMSKETHGQIEQIVLGGLRADKGMPNFSGELTKDDVARIHDYIIARANEDYFTEK